MGILDGDPAGPSDLDPTHLRAIGERLAQVVAAVNQVQREGTQRDYKIDEIREAGKGRDAALLDLSVEVGVVKQKVVSIESEVEQILRRTNQFTDEQVRDLLTIIMGQTYKKRLWKDVTKYLGWAAAIVTFVFTTREWITEAVNWVLHR